MEYLSVQDISNKWNISKRRIQILCREGRIDGAKMIGNMWVVPEDAVRPTDARTKNPIVEKRKNFSWVRVDLKKILKSMYKMTEEYEFDGTDMKIYVLSILAGTLCSIYMENKNHQSGIIDQIFCDISGKTNPYQIDKNIVKWLLILLKHIKMIRK